MANQVKNEIWKTRPTYSSPAKISIDSPVVDDKNCGQDWSEIEIRQPYKSIDMYVEVLPQLNTYGIDGLGNAMGAERAKITHEWVEKGIVDEVIDRAEALLEEYNMDSQNQNAIQGYIDNAIKYLERATEIWKWWDGEFVPYGTPWQPKGPQGHPHYFVSVMESPHWPLSRHGARGCGSDPGSLSTVPTSKLDYVHPRPLENAPDIWPDFLTIRCPNNTEQVGHEHDANLYAELILSAIAHARCAAEAAAAVGIFYKNKARVSGKILAPKVSKFPSSGSKIYAPGPGGGLGGKGAGSYAVQPGEPHPPIIEPPEGGVGGGIPGPEEPHVPSDTSKPTKKKKDNTLLIAGAAAVGLFLFGKK